MLLEILIKLRTMSLFLLVFLFNFSQRDNISTVTDADKLGTLRYNDDKESRKIKITFSKVRIKTTSRGDDADNEENESIT